MESARDGASAQPAPQPAGENERKVQRDRQGLLLSRAYVLHQIESSSNERYTQSLKQALSEIDQKLARLDGH